MTDEDALRRAKRRVGEALLGRHGVHGVGSSRRAEEVILRVDPRDGGVPSGVLQDAQRLAEPFSLRLVEEDAARFASDL